VKRTSANTTPEYKMFMVDDEWGKMDSLSVITKEKTHAQLEEHSLNTVEGLRMFVDAKDVYMRGHSERVAHFAVEIGKAFQLSEEELELLRLSGIFHDVGKIGTPDAVLFKTAGLNEEEYEEIKKHPLRGARILSAISMFEEIVPIVKSHHERVDGRGYPEGLKKDEIPFLARIITVADAFDAMISDRRYRMKLKFEEARAQLLQGAGRQFDEEVVKRFDGEVLRCWEQEHRETAPVAADGEKL
jgi:putative nucleotidyltransferase with HDIG domain